MFPVSFSMYYTILNVGVRSITKAVDFGYNFCRRAITREFKRKFVKTGKKFRRYKKVSFPI